MLSRLGADVSPATESGGYGAVRLGMLDMTSGDRVPFSAGGGAGAESKSAEVDPEGMLELALTAGGALVDDADAGVAGGGCDVDRLG